MKFRRPTLTIEATLLNETIWENLQLSGIPPHYLVTYDSGQQRILSEEELTAEGFLLIGRSPKTGQLDQKPKKPRKPRERKALGSSPLAETNHEDVGSEAEA